MVLRFFLLAFAFLFSCTSVERDNCLDSGGINYNGCVGGVSSSSALISSSSSTPPPLISDYRTKQIGAEWWMLQNLNYNADGSRCYDDNSYNCSTYGRLYSWAIAMNLPEDCNRKRCSSLISEPHQGICPSGWHIPSRAEWSNLIGLVVYNGDEVGTALKSENMWKEKHDGTNGNGTNVYTFTALPAGWCCRSEDGSFSGIGEATSWWSTGETGSNKAYGPGIRYSGANVDEGDLDKAELFSVRCVKD